jgi:hypothetical protein
MRITLNLPTAMQYQVIMPVRGIREGQRQSTLFPQGTLLEVLPGDSGTPLVRVRCNGRNYLVLENDLMQWCERSK